MVKMFFAAKGTSMLDALPSFPHLKGNLFLSRRHLATTGIGPTGAEFDASFLLYDGSGLSQERGLRTIQGSSDTLRQPVKPAGDPPKVLHDQPA